MKKSHLKILFFMLILTAAMPLFAAGGDLIPSGLTSIGEQVQGIFTGPLVTIICVCCLAGCGIAYAFNKDNEKMKRNIIAIGIGIVIIATASGIVGKIFSAASGNN